MTDPDTLRDLQRLGERIAAFLDAIPVVESLAYAHIGSYAPSAKPITVDPKLLREAARVLSAAPYILR
jgi:hypothetical protein